MKADVVIVGLGYIGLPTAAVLANKGLNVWGVDINDDVVQTINRGEIHIFEPDLKDMVAQAVKSQKLQASTEIIQAKTYLVVVPTPFKENHQPDTSFVEKAIENITPHLQPEDLVIIESTSPIGTTERMQNLVFSLRPELKNQIHFAYCPERVLPGNILHELIYNDRVIGGTTEKATEKAMQFYTQFVQGELHATNAKTAEMCKLTENSSRDVQIAFANELSLICEKADIDVWELIQLANKHPRVNILNPGCGVGGHCIAVDPYFILSDFPMESQLIGKAREINNYKSFWCAEQIKKARKDFEIKNGKSPAIALLGLAFKPNIDDLRESPAKYIVQKVLQDAQDEDYYIVEPNIATHKIFKLTPYQEAIEKADIIAILVAHDEFENLDLKDKIVLDFCGVQSKKH
ncbi:UDP-N-acetyl-D-mannosamine dehydrogenase [Ornithobacterium rhinotracheale]|uniref:Nucleotide sugar dehydrogenase n=1 Tax=Ornithobacterium rhinotracheale (strain ATCC 51463 / DSM 15997 / CCUG 23171 / CIP 104009 / LMG 9086) TaxID=867902 RepID=I3ZX17_ORNRL|nr:UDP-N-acetyl-D-mannosamine dehydrogenase [Ornithobacterium rhinotracheale]AFL96251.1 nucleotide sugar dehydrogenase [Ornithobacterium rhinotracheale DSM 15997]AIP98490.1 UDP-N-acetyl-D-mannosamine dehydrogenase [Ornithobacterium rhinotracheale ORT-UMN 88]KGB67903.1 UDP-N-acetyl-D-mannosamine dehydrogenase [Ornithobacterium rhinotracheale H06-030791]MBN3663120.1 UDP-N-acetyl-D-mannosamine dehydrogenase [Ornithobacterium rhinotracheale]MCK0193137.1 UDP-N-acetyl-D-mannosamine dehydrogenase [Or